MRVMNIWDLRELGFTHYRVRALVEAVNRSEPEYAWVQAVLIRDGLKKPKVIPELFVQAYKSFRLKQVEDEIASIQEKLGAFARRRAA